MAFIIGTSTSNTQILAAGTTAERPATPSAGQMRYNSTTGGFEVYAGTSWSQFGSSLGTINNPAISATAIKSANPEATSGLYWLKPSAWNYPAQFYCEMSLHGGGWIYVLQRQCSGTGGAASNLPGSWLTSTFGTPNHATNNFYGVTDSNGTTKTPQDVWNGFIGSSSNGKWFAREIQTAGGSYDESQRYVGSSDNAIYTYTEFARHFSGNYTNGTWKTGVRVYYNNGSSYVDGKTSTTWSAPSLATINNGNVDQDEWFCNGTDNYDNNWAFALMKGGTPYPRTADSNNGGNRGGITRWGIIAIKA